MTSVACSGLESLSNPILQPRSKLDVGTISFCCLNDPSAIVIDIGIPHSVFSLNLENGKMMTENIINENIDFRRCCLQTEMITPKGHKAMLLIRKGLEGILGEMSVMF